MKFSIYQQRRIVAVSSMVVFGVGTAARLHRGANWLDQDAARFYIGVGMAFTFVSVFTDLGLPIGAGFALLIMVAALIQNGEDAFALIGERSKRTGKRPRKQSRGAAAQPRQPLEPLEPITP